MTTAKPTRPSAPAQTKPVQIKGVTNEVARRLKIAAAEEGLTYAQLIESWLDARDRRINRARAAQAHPLHRPTNAVQMETA